eukprot:5604366-Pleurochrysis_carterae.AAC.1
MKHGQQTKLKFACKAEYQVEFQVQASTSPCGNAMKPGLALALNYGRQNLVSGKPVIVVWNAVLYNKKQFVSKQPKALAKKNKPTVA